MSFNIIVRTGSRSSRHYDLEHLRVAHANTKDPKERAKIESTAKKIASESRAVEGMRQSLIRSHRRGNADEVKDTHEFIKNKSKYK